MSKAQGPSGGVLDAHLFDAEMPASNEFQQGRRAFQRRPVKYGDVSPALLRWRHNTPTRHPEMRALPVDAPRTCQARILRIAGEDQVPCVHVNLCLPSRLRSV